MNAVREAFPGVTIAGCLFYLGQSFWRRLQAEGLMEAYQDEGNSELLAQFRSLIALALVPENDVPDAYDDLREDVVEELNPVFNYVEDNYVKA